MDSVAELINRFKAEQTSQLGNIDKSQKPSIVVALEDFADDERVIHFLLSVAADESEYDLGRIEVFKVLEVMECDNPETRQRVGHVIEQVLSQSKDDEVRNYAAMAAASYMDIEGVALEIHRIVHDPQADSNHRWNAFAAIKATPGSPKSIESLRRLLADDEFKQSATRLLTEWGDL